MQQKIGNLSPACALVGRDVTYRGLTMLVTTTKTGCRSEAARAAQPSSSDQALSSDQMLLARIARGDALAMRTLYARHYTSVYRWLVRLMRNGALAEDLLSEVFLDVWRQAASFQGRCSVSTWLLAIARHKALSARRRRIDDQLDDAAAAEIPDPADDPETALAKKDRGELLRSAMAQLSDEHREVLDLVYYHDCSVKETAEIVGVGEATVKTRMFYARKRLEGLLGAAA
jgi:RNA polymerase sigma-70 factor (ECF subfamily)